MITIVVILKSLSVYVTKVFHILLEFIFTITLLFLTGFGEITQDDQIILIKKGSFEILLNRMCLLVDHDTQEMFDPEMAMKCPR